MEPNGLYYIENYITAAESSEILLFIEREEWKPVGNGKNSRKVVHYGYSYNYKRSGTEKINDIPEFLKRFVNKERIEKEMNIEIPEFNQLIINEYLPGQGIAAHIDHVKQFGNIILCISLGSDIVIDFIGEGRKISHLIKENSLYIMSGAARYEYSHEIAARKSDNGVARKNRISLTYRIV